MFRSISSYSLLVPVLAATLALTLSGCQKYGQQQARVATGSPTLDPNNKTSDGYTPEQKTYFTDIQKLKSYETTLAPIFQKLKLSSWTGGIQAKKWLFVPQDLNADDSRNMAVHFLDGEDKALAIQTSNDIRVQKILFEKLSSEEQADFLMTEILTSVYLFRNLNDTELCALVRVGHKDIACPFLKSVKSDASETEELDSTKEADQQTDIEGPGEIQDAGGINKINPRTEQRIQSVNNPKYGKKERLSPSEYHKIKLLVDFLNENAKDIDQPAMIKKMIELGFDTRIFQVQFPG